MGKKKKNKANDVFWIKKNFSRRKFINGTINGVAVSIGLPIFDYLLNNNGTAMAQGTPLPLRFGTFFWGLGYGLDKGHWTPSGSGAGSSWSIPNNHGLSGLNAHKDYLTVFSNYSHSNPSGAGHIPQRGVSVSASHNPTWVQHSSSGFRRQNMPLPTIDQLIYENWQGSLGTTHDYINATLKLGSLYVGTSSWARGGSYRLFHRTPLEFYDKVFKPIQGTTPAPPNPNQSLVNATNGLKKSVLDGTISEMNSFNQTLGSDDKLKLDSHLTKIREMERNLASAGTIIDPGNCGNIAVPNNYASANDISKRHNVMAELMVYALSCNLTRIFCYEFAPTQCNALIPEVGLTSSQGLHDGYSHGNVEGMKTYLSYVMNNLGVFAGKLKATSEGAGNLLDNMLMLGTSEYAGPHHHRSHPYLLLGKAGGNVKGNYHETLGSESNNEASRILLTAAHAVGVKLPKLGMPATAVTGQSGGPSKTANYEATQPITSVLKT